MIYQYLTSLHVGDIPLGVCRNEREYLLRYRTRLDREWMDPSVSSTSKLLGGSQRGCMRVDPLPEVAPPATKAIEFALAVDLHGPARVDQLVDGELGVPVAAIQQVGHSAEAEARSVAPTTKHPLGIVRQATCLPSLAWGGASRSCPHDSCSTSGSPPLYWMWTCPSEGGPRTERPRPLSSDRSGYPP